MTSFKHHEKDFYIRVSSTCTCIFFHLVILITLTFTGLVFRIKSKWSNQYTQTDCRKTSKQNFWPFCIGYWPSVRSIWLDIGQVLFFCLFMEWDGVKVHSSPKKEGGLYPAIFTKQTWSRKDLFMAFGDIFIAGHGRCSWAGKIAPCCLPG